MTLTDEHVPAPALDLPVAPEPLRPVRAAVFGLGRAGVMHAALLSTITQCELVAIGDAGSAARRNARGCGLKARAFAKLGTLLETASPEVVFVCGVPPQRVEWALEALEAGAAVFLEASPGLEIAEAEPLAARAREFSRPVAVGVPVSHHPVFDAARRLLASGVPGSVRQVRASRNVSRVFSPAQQKSHLISPERGALAHAASDLLFELVACFGPAVFASATAQNVYGPIEDEMRGAFTTTTGAEIGFEVSWSSPGYPRPATVIEVEANGGRLLVSDDALEIDLEQPGGGFPVGVTRLGHDAMPRLARFELDGDGLYLEDAGFLHWATGGVAAPGQIESWLAPARLMHALYVSARNAGIRVEVPA